MNSYGITQLPSYAFYGCKAISALDATSLTAHNQYIFYNSGITNLILDNHGASSSIAAYAYGNCTSLATITDRSTTPWTTLNNQAFSGVNNNATINSLVFGLYKQSSGFTISPMSNNTIYSYAFGDVIFTAPSGAYFANEATSKTLTLGKTGSVEDLTDRLKLEYITLTINSNMADSRYRLDYTASDGTEKNEEVGVGANKVNATSGTTITITPITSYDGYIAPQATTVTMSSASYSQTMDYTEETLIYIKHINGTLYTTDEWTSGGYSNDVADGVCVMRSESGGFVIAKEDVSSSMYSWGGYNIDLIGLERLNISKDTDGYGNTHKIIEQIGTGNAPAAEACVAYTFPSGTKGYLPALGEWYIASNHIDAIKSARSLIGSVGMNALYYWSSSSGDSTRAYSFYTGKLESFARGRGEACNVIAFSPYGQLIISSNIGTRFTLTYTNNYEKSVSKEVLQGSHSLNIKLGTTITITPQSIGNITSEPQSFTWTDSVHEASFTFAKDAGVYIQHVNGTLYTTDEWTSGGYNNDSANGVAVLSNDSSFVVAKSYQTQKAFSGSGKTIDTLRRYTTVADAICDNDGYSNTDKIIIGYSGYTNNGVTGAPAAEACAAYTFPNGKKGYLASAGEWKLVLDNLTVIQSALRLLGGAIRTGYNTFYFTSTQLNNTLSTWSVNTYDKTLTTSSKITQSNIHPFGRL